MIINKKEIIEMVSNNVSSKLRSFGMNERASGSIGTIMGFFILAILIAAFIPSTIATLAGVNTSGWGATELVIYGTFTVFIMISVMYLIIPKELLNKM